MLRPRSSVVDALSVVRLLCPAKLMVDMAVDRESPLVVFVAAVVVMATVVAAVIVVATLLVMAFVSAAGCWCRGRGGGWRSVVVVIVVAVVVVVVVVGGFVGAIEGQDGEGPSNSTDLTLSDSDNHSWARQHSAFWSVP